LQQRERSRAQGCHGQPRQRGSRRLATTRLRGAVSGTSWRQWDIDHEHKGEAAHRVPRNVLDIGIAPGL
jgi:hypothetical protein